MTSVLASNDSKLRKFSKKPIWLKAIHRQGDPVDGEGFNLAQSSYDELIETIEAFKRPRGFQMGKRKKHPQCLFPYRKKLLQKYLDLSFSNVECPEFEKWFNEMNPKGLSLIFAGNHPDNPASIFGHTFLKLTRKSKKKKSPFSDYAIDFSASVGNDSGITFAFLGLMGGYEGHFSISPYFVKLKEYTRIESRELWEYKLKLNESEIKDVLRHLWELESTTYFDYFFLDENCSYRLLTLVEVIRPNLDLTSSFLIFTPPTRTVRVFKENGLINEGHFTPSLKQKISSSLNSLDSNDINEFKKSLDQKNNDPKWLDLAIQYYDYQKVYRGLNSDELQVFNSLLSKRSKSNFLWQQPQVQRPPNPLESHDELSFSYGVSNSFDTAIFLSSRLGIHNIIDPPTGYLPRSNLEVLDFSLSYFKDEKKLALNRFAIANIGVLNPITWWEKKVSWKVRAFYNRSFLNDCKLCQEWVISPGVGYAVGEIVTVYSLVYGESVWSEDIRQEFRIGLRPEIGVLVPTEKSILGIISLTASTFYQFNENIRWNDYQVKFNQSFRLNKSNQIQLGVFWRSYFNSDVELSLAHRIFF